MRAAIDKAGRVVIPKAVREAAGLKPGVELDIRYRGGIVEIEPKLEGPRLEYRNGVLVGVLDDPGDVSENEVDDLIQQLRDDGLGGGFEDVDRS